MSHLVDVGRIMDKEQSMGLAEGNGTHEEGLVGYRVRMERGGSISTMQACGRVKCMHGQHACS